MHWPLLRGVSWLRNNYQYPILLLLDLIFYDGWSVTTGITPAGDVRAHIFRTLEFIPGLLGGDYTPIQYHGYAFLAGYGVGFYVFTSAISSACALFVAGFEAATIACNVMWVITPLILALAAIKLADGLGMAGSDHSQLMKLGLGATVLLFPGVVKTNFLGADPYILSFSFSMLALECGLRPRQDQGALLSLLAFSALSIYMEDFGYFFIGAVFLVLLAMRRPVLRIIPFLVGVTAFSWVQLLEVSRYMAPYIEEVPLFTVGFLPLLGILALVVCAYSCLVFLFRRRIDEGHKAICVIVAATTAVAALASVRASFGWDLGIMNSLVDSFLPWRLLFVNIPVLILVSAYAWSSGKTRFRSSRKAVAVVSIFMISLPIFLGAYPIAFGPMPSASNYESYTGRRLLVAGSALTSPSSPVDYSPAFGYSTVSGPFSQGDPSFFALTAYYEWSDSLICNNVVAENLMHLTGADEIVGQTTRCETQVSIGPPGKQPKHFAPPLSDDSGMEEATKNASYAFVLNTSQAEAVTPILLEAPNSTDALQFALFVNVLGENGYKLDFVTSAPASELYGVVVLPGYRGASPQGLPTYVVSNGRLAQSGFGVPVVKPFVASSSEPVGSVSGATFIAASLMAATLIAFFHPTYSPAALSEGQDYYSVSSNYTLPIQLSVSYYPYFNPANYSQNIYHFILLPESETITWHLPFYEIAGAVSLAVALASVLFRRKLLPNPYPPNKPLDNPTSGEGAGATTNSTKTQ